MPKVLVPLANGCEELEAITIIDLLRRANIEVITASLEAAPVQGAHNITITADTTLAAVMEDSFDLLVLPGGLPGADYLNADPRIHQLIKRQAANDQYVAAICAAPKVLIDNGIVDERKLTAYPGALEATDTSRVEVTGSAVEVDNKIITSRGPGTAMDFALQLIETLLDKASRDQVEAALQRP